MKNNSYISIERKSINMEALQKLFMEYRIASNDLYEAERLAGTSCVDIRWLTDYTIKKEAWEKAAKDYSRLKWL